MWQITRADLRTQLVEYVKKKKIIDDDDNGTVVWHRLSHLNTRYEQYNDRYITRRHRAYYCINYVRLFALFTIILFLAYTGTPPFWLVQKLKQAKLGGHFSTYGIETGWFVH